MSSQDYATSITVERTPAYVFDAITDPRRWWSGEFEGPTDEVGGVFTYRYEDLHISKQKVTELVPGKRVVWLVGGHAGTFPGHDRNCSRCGELRRWSTGIRRKPDRSRDGRDS